MSKLLHVNSSVRASGSNSRALGEFFVQSWKLRHPDGAVTYRDVGRRPPPHPTEAYTVANYTPAGERSATMNKELAVSDELIDELTDAQRLVFAVPMYNFSVPSTFKAYIDNLVRVGRTFEATDTGELRGLLTGKKALVISTRGAQYGPASPIAEFDHQTPWLRTVFGFIGITDISFVNADGMDFGAASEREANLEAARSQLETLAKTW